MELCYLDGRYFNLVFAKYNGLISTDLSIKCIESDGLTTFKMGMPSVNYHKNSIGLLHLKIYHIEKNTHPDEKTKEIVKDIHSNVLFLNYKEKKIYRFESLGKSSPYFNTINKLLQDYFTKTLKSKYTVTSLNNDNIYNFENSKCLQNNEKSGFCNAYNIMYAYAYLNGRPFRSERVYNFAEKVVSLYGPLSEPAEPEYGYNDWHGGYRNRHGYNYGGYGNRYNYNGYNNLGGTAGLLGGLVLGTALAGAGLGNSPNYTTTYSPYTYNPYVYGQPIYRQPVYNPYVYGQPVYNYPLF